jgi:hypothetical protein
MFTEYRDNGLLGNGRVLGWLLGREPTRFTDAVRADLGHSASWSHNAVQRASKTA